MSHRSATQQGQASRDGVLSSAQVSQTSADNLPPELKEVIVTIDGPAGTGKSSVGRVLAIRLGLEFLDTGAMYRAATALGLDRELTRHDTKEIAALAAAADLHFDWRMDPPALLAFDEPFTHRLRDTDVTSNVSAFSAIAELREVLSRKQRIIGAQHPRLVSEGRDQGSVVFPKANIKIYIDASPRVRAGRRARQLEKAGRPADIEAIEKEIIARDDSDRNRAVGPLIQPVDAIAVDTSNLSFDEVVDHLESLVHERLDEQAQ